LALLLKRQMAVVDADDAQHLFGEGGGDGFKRLGRLFVKRPGRFAEQQNRGDGVSLVPAGNREQVRVGEPRICLAQPLLDIARMIAKGADFVLLGRALALSVAALGPHGPSHALKILTEEFAMTLSQLGCSDWRDLPKFLQE